MPSLVSPRQGLEGDHVSWDYRVIKRLFNDAEALYTVHEVYYDEGGLPNGWTQFDVSPAGETPAEAYESLKLYLRAFGKPVLVVRIDGTTETMEGEEPPILGTATFA